MRDPGFRGRLLKALLYSALIATAFGIPIAATEYLVPGHHIADISNAPIIGGNVAAIVFWIAFAYLFLIKVYKTPAVFDFERRVKMAEEIFARRRQR